MHDFVYVSLAFQIPAQNMFWVGFWGPNTSSQSVWKLKVYKYRKNILGLQSLVTPTPTMVILLPCGGWVVAVAVVIFVALDVIVIIVDVVQVVLHGVV